MSQTTSNATRWLTAEEQDAWIGMTAIMWLLPAPLDAQLQRDSGLTLFEYFVLSSLSMAPDRRRRMRELARMINASPSRLSNVVNKLEAQGWVLRTVDPADRRGAVAELTASGWDVVVAAAPQHVATVRALAIDQLTGDQIAALSSLGRSLQQSLTGTTLGSGDPCEAACDEPGTPTATGAC